MLRHVAAWLAEYYSGFHVFQYLTLRAILAALTALAIVDAFRFSWSISS